MIDYEILLLFDAELPEERQNEIVTRTRELIERGGGTFESHDVWGRRRLAYEIDHKAEGIYHLLTFQAEPGTLVAWNNLLGDGTPNPATLHQGMRVRKGTKYIVTKWFRERAL